MKKILLSIFSFFLLLQACSIVSEKDLNRLKKYKGPVSLTHNLNTLYSDSAKKKITMKAKLREEFQDGNQEFPEGILVEFYNEKQVKTTVLTAKTAFYFKEQNQYVARENVVVINLEKNDTLRTEELNWKPQATKKEEQLFTDKDVKITTPRETLLGTGLKAKQDFTWYKILIPKMKLYRNDIGR